MFPYSVLEHIENTFKYISFSIKNIKQAEMQVYRQTGVPCVKTPVRTLDSGYY